MKIQDHFLETCALIVASIFVFLVPLAFFPKGIIDTSYAKIAFLSLGVIASAILFLLDKLRHHKITIRPLLSVPVIILDLVLIASSIFSIDPLKSFFGTNFGVYSTNFLLIVSVLYLILINGVLKKKKDVLSLMFVFLLSSFLAVIFDILRFTIKDFYNLSGIWGINSGSILGSLNDLGLMAGLLTVVFVLSAELFSMKKAAKAVLSVFALISLVVVVFVNFKLNLYFFAIPLVSFIAFIFLVLLYVLYASERKTYSEDVIPNQTKQKHWILISFLIVSVALIFFGGNISSMISSYFSEYFSETNLSWQSTMTVADNVLLQKPILGTGPATFDLDWDLYKPESINASNYWNTDFYGGVGYIPTEIVTEGAFGVLAWLGFVGLILYVSFELLRQNYKDRRNRAIVFISVSSLLYLLVAAVFYNPSSPIILGLFTFTACAAFLLDEIYKKKASKKDFSNYPKAFISIAGIALIVVCAYWGIVMVRKSVAYYFANDALLKNNAQEAANETLKAIAIDPEGSYYRTLAGIYIYDINQIFKSSNASGSGQLSPEASNALISDANKTVAAINLSEKYDFQNFRTYISSGGLYESLASFGAPSFYTNAFDGYKKAAALAPRNPLPLVLMARVEVEQNNLSQGQIYLNQVFSLKPDYYDAYMLEAEIKVKQNDTKGAEDLIIQAATSYPYNADLTYQAGLIEYSNADYQDAANFLYQSVKYNPYQMQARLNLALALYNLGFKEDAINEMSVVIASGQANDSTKALLQKMQNGEPIVASEQAPTETASSTTAATITSKKSKKTISK